jgi:hypothetical protein
MKSGFDNLMCFEPVGRLAQFRKLKGSLHQLPTFLATAAGIKPAMDDWIPVQHLDEYVALACSSGLLIREDVMFEPLSEDENVAGIVGFDRLTTTYARGRTKQASQHSLACEAHVFLSRNRALLEEVYESGCYPLIAGDRAVVPPAIGAKRFGASLGYPSCCIKFFDMENDWGNRNHYHAIWKNSVSNASFICNHLLKNIGFSYVPFMPCAFSCKSTQEYAIAVRSEILTQDPGYCEIMDTILRKPFFVCSENRVYVLDGECRSTNEVCYSSVLYVGTEPRQDAYGSILGHGDELRIEENVVFVLRKGRLVSAFEVRQDSRPVERPFLVQL